MRTVFDESVAELDRTGCESFSLGLTAMNKSTRKGTFVKDENTALIC